MKVSVIMLIVLFLVVPVPVLAQSSSPLKLQWSEAYDNFSVSSMISTHDGGTLIAGYAPATYPRVASLMKFYNDSSVEWVKTYPETNDLLLLIQEVDSGYLLTNFGYYDETLKIDFQGNLEWTGPYNLWGTAQSTAEDGSYIMTRNSQTSWNHDSSVGKYDADGVLLWSKIFSDANIEASLQSDSSDDYYIAGTILKNSLFGGKSWCFWFAKLDLNGEITWSRTYNYKTPESTTLFFDSVIQTLDGGFLLSGSNTGNSYEQSSWVVKTDRNGREQWHQQYANNVTIGDGQYSCRIRDVVQVGSSHYLVLRDYDIIVLDERGNELWVESYFAPVEGRENSNFDMVLDVSSVVGDDGNLVVAVTYHLNPIYPSIDGTHVVWLANFALTPLTQSDSCMLLFGVAIIVGVVGVVVGFLIYSKKYRHHKYRLANPECAYFVKCTGGYLLIGLNVKS